MNAPTEESLPWLSTKLPKRRKWRMKTRSVS